MADKKHDDPKTDNEDMSEGGQVSEGPSGMDNLETAVGGADSVADTPDALPYRPDETDPVNGS